MATGQGTVTIDFGAEPGSNEATVNATGAFVTAVSATSKCEAYINGASTAGTHTANDHKYLGQFASFTCGTPVAATSIPVYGRSIHKMSGQWLLNVVWAD
jgi:hypothetical protein